MPLHNHLPDGNRGPEQELRLISETEAAKGKRITTCLVLIVPYGLNSTIFPWGVHHIRDYVLYKVPGIMVKIWDLRNDPQIQTAINYFRESADKSFSYLETITDSANYPLKTMAVLSEFGPRCLAERGESKSALDIWSNCGTKLQAALARMKVVINRRAQSFFPRVPHSENGQVIFGLSVFDSTLLECLYVSKLLHDHERQNIVIMGGSYFYPQNARHVLERATWVQTIVAGWGEGAVAALAQAVSQGNSVDTVHLPGVYTRPCLFESPETVGYSSPISCYSSSSQKPLSYVNLSGGKLHVLTYHGCDWGKCTFCSDWAHRYNFTIPAAPIIEELLSKSSLIRAWEGKPQERFTVSIDSDSTSPPELIAILSTLFNTILDARITRRANLFFWQRVAQLCKYAPQMTELFLMLESRGVLLTPSLGIETLSPAVLRMMCKGSTVPQNIFALKLLRDIGVARIGFNYFFTFPSERRSDVQEEVRILLKCMHLLTMPLVFYGRTLYGSSEYDEIWKSQKQYGIVVGPHTDNRWEAAFRPGLPNYRMSRSIGLLDSHGYDENEKAWHHIVYSREFVQWLSNLYSNKTSSDFARLDSFNLDPVYAERVKALIQPWAWWQKAWRDADFRQPTFVLHGNVLHKRYPEPYYTHWEMKLDDGELEVLQSLYMPQRKDQLIERLGSDSLVSRLDEILTRHIGNGSILKIGEQYIAVFNDPDGPKRLTLNCDECL